MGDFPGGAQDLFSFRGGTAPLKNRSLAVAAQ
jgi:hypothetical protein